MKKNPKFKSIIIRVAISAFIAFALGGIPFVVTRVNPLEIKWVYGIYRLFIIAFFLILYKRSFDWFPDSNKKSKPIGYIMHGGGSRL